MLKMIAHRLQQTEKLIGALKQCRLSNAKKDTAKVEQLANQLWAKLKFDGCDTEYFDKVSKRIAAQRDKRTKQYTEPRNGPGKLPF